MDTNKLLYIIWGTKRGADSFFGSSDLNINSGEIQVSLKDIRAFANFSETKIDFYSLQFTSQYKVYTQHRTLNDWLGRPGFMAITVYIPHLLKIRDRNVLDLLNEMVDSYWKKHVNENNRRIKEEREDRSYFNNLIASIELIKDDDSSITKSQQSDKIGLIRYKDYDDLKTYFDLPYQKEYYNFQKIMFFSEDDEHPLSTLMPLTIKPTRQKKYSIEIIGDFDREKSRYFVNDSEVDYLTGLVPSDMISLTLVRAFYEPLNYFDSVQSLIQKCHVNNTIIEILPNSDFTPVIKNVYISFIDSETYSLLTNLIGTIKINGIKENGQPIVLTGIQIGKKNTVEIKIRGYKEVKFELGPYPVIFKNEDISFGSIVLEPENQLIPEQELVIYPVKSSTNDPYQNNVQRHDPSIRQESLHQRTESLKNQDNEEITSKRLKELQHNESSFKKQLNNRRTIFNNIRIFIFIGCVVIGSIATLLIIKKTKQAGTTVVYKFVAENGGGIDSINYDLSNKSILSANRDSIIIKYKNEKETQKSKDEITDEITIVIYPKDSIYYENKKLSLIRNETKEEISVEFILKENIEKKRKILCDYCNRLNNIDDITNKLVDSIIVFIKHDTGFVDYFIKSCKNPLFDSRERLNKRIGCLKHIFFILKKRTAHDYIINIGEGTVFYIEYCFGLKSESDVDREKIRMINNSTTEAPRVLDEELNSQLKPIFKGVKSSAELRDIRKKQVITLKEIFELK